MKKVKYGAYRLEDRAISNEEIFLLIQHILNEGKEDYEKKILIGDEVVYISDKKILDRTKKLLTSNNLFNLGDKTVSRFRIDLSKTNINSDASVRIWAMFIGVYLRYTAFASQYEKYVGKPAPKLKFEIHELRLYQNLDAVLSFMKKDFTTSYINKTPNKKKESIQEVILKMSTSDYDNDKDTFVKDIRHLETLKDSLGFESELNQKETKSYPFNRQIGALFAQGFITKRNITGVGCDYYFKENKFDSISSLSKFIQEHILKTEQNVRQYITATLNDGDMSKNFYKNNKLNKITIEYCADNNIKINEDFRLQFD
jgi:hypothetical protein